MDLRNWVGIPFERSNCLQLAVSLARSRGHDIPEREDICGMPGEADPWWAWWDDRSHHGDPSEGDVLVVRSVGTLGVGTLGGYRMVLTTTPCTGSLLMSVRRFIAPGLLGVFRPRTTPKPRPREIAP